MGFNSGFKGLITNARLCKLQWLKLCK